TTIGFSPFSPNRTAPTSHDVAKRNTSNVKAKIRTDRYLDNKIFVRDIGRISNNLIVPHLNSFEMMPAATMIVNRLMTDVRKLFSSTYSQPSYGCGLMSFSRW